jgi:uncharacterized protein YecT (DUF1311 family)
MLRALVALMVNMDREKDSKKKSSDMPRPAQTRDSEKQLLKASLKPPILVLRRKLVEAIYLKTSLRKQESLKGMNMRAGLLSIFSAFIAGIFSFSAAQAACPGDTQMEMNSCAASDYSRADEELNTVWRKLPKSKELLASQRAWIAYRDAECYFRKAQFEGGSIAPLIYSSCLSELTKQRTKIFIDNKSLFQ